MSTTEVPTTFSLYEQLGGAANLAAVVDDFYSQVLADDGLKGFFAHVDLDQLRRHQARFLGYALGGPNQYSGRGMRVAHTGLGITQEQFTAVAGHLATALAAFGVPDPLIAKVVGHAASLQPDVVGR